MHRLINADVTALNSAIREDEMCRPVISIDELVMHHSIALAGHLMNGIVAEDD